MIEFANDEHIGRRVAMLFDVQADDGDNIYRGTVVGVNERDGAKEYGIKYDDGDTEDVSVGTFCSAHDPSTCHNDKYRCCYTNADKNNLQANIAIKPAAKLNNQRTTITRGRPHKTPSQPP